MVDRDDELNDRMTAKRKELEAELEHAKADVRGKKNDTIEELEARLGEVRDYLSRGIKNLSKTTKDKLNDWLR